MCGAEKDGYLETYFFSPHYFRQRFQKRRNGGISISIFWMPVFFSCNFFLPPLIQGETQVCILSFASPNPDIGFPQSSELMLESFSLIFEHHSETCLASASSVILKFPLDLLGVVTEVHISQMHLSDYTWIYIAESRWNSVSLVHESFWVLSAVLNEVIWTKIFKALEDI